jgi:thiol-disulfide isomerase/thioredoxin
MKKINILPENEKLFYDEVGKRPVFVKFYMDGCPHCENMKPAWIDLENELMQKYQGDFTIMDVNARALNTLKSPITQYVEGFPSIFIIKKDGSKGLDFEGERTKDDMLKFVLDNVSEINKKESSHPTSMSMSIPMPMPMPMQIIRKYKTKQSKKRRNTKKTRKTKTKNKIKRRKNKKTIKSRK